MLEWGDGIEEGDRIALEDLGVETRLRITRGAPAEGYDDIAEGWITFAHQLRFAIERGGREERRTLHLTRRRAVPGAAALAAELPGAPWYRDGAPGRHRHQGRPAGGLGEAAGRHGGDDALALRRRAGRGGLARLVAEHVAR